MKRIILIAASALAFASLGGCAGAITKDPTTGAVTVDLTKGELAVATHADLQAAAKYAADHGFPARAAVRQAMDTLLTAIETQGSACANAIAAAIPKPPAAGAGPLTPILAAEMAEEALGNFSGIPAQVKILCAPIPIPALPGLPKLP